MVQSVQQKISNESQTQPLLNYKEKHMNQVELYQKIELQPEIIQKLAALNKEIELGEIEHYLNRLMDIQTAHAACQELEEYFQDDADQLRLLFCELECARRLYARYQEKGIPESVFLATMKCFPRFIDECEKKNGRKYFNRAWWAYRHISMELFRIGDLEYQFSEYDGERTIAIHIPSDAVFSSDAVEASIHQADLFFQTYYPEYHYTKYTCDSWLLSPVLNQLLPASSNIADFRRRFKIVNINKEDCKYISWLFQRPLDTIPDQLPERTSLQRSVKKLLLDGKSVGAAFGVMKAST